MIMVTGPRRLKRYWIKVSVVWTIIEVTVELQTRDICDKLIKEDKIYPP